MMGGIRNWRRSTKERCDCHPDQSLIGNLQGANTDLNTIATKQAAAVNKAMNQINILASARKMIKFSWDKYDSLGFESKLVFVTYHPVLILYRFDSRM